MPRLGRRLPAAALTIWCRLLLPLQEGSKAIFHLEAFLARFMSNYKQARSSARRGSAVRGLGVGTHGWHRCRACCGAPAWLQHASGTHLRLADEQPRGAGLQEP